jgi:hypothetical protein
MNKLKNIGISALAGSLVSLSAAQAGGVSVSGSWELSYTNLNHEKVTGNKLGMNKNISFGASGDVSDGGAVTWATTIGGTDAMGLSSASMNINMGGIATLAYDSGTGGYGANAVDNIVPTAWEEIDYGFDTGISDVGVVTKSKGVVNLTVKAPTAGTGISLSYVGRVGGGHIADGATSGEVNGGRGIDAVVDFVNYDAKHFGLRAGVAGEIEIKDFTCKSTMINNQNESCSTGYKDNPMAGTTYFSMKLGPIHFGTQATFKELNEAAASAVMNKRSIVGGVALLIGDTISLSYGEAWDRYRYNDRNRGSDNPNPGQIPEAGAEVTGPEEHEYETIKFRGFSAAINVGPAALKATRNHVDGVGEGGAGDPKSHSEINLSIAF